MSNKWTLSVVFQENYKLLFRIVYSNVCNVDDTLDVLQESFLKAFLHFDPTMSENEIIKWLIIITKNTAKTFIKQNKSFEPLDDYIDNIESPDISFIDIFLFDLKAVKTTVPDVLFDYLMMNILNEVPLLNISKKTGVSYEKLRYWRKILLNELTKWIKDYANC